MSTQLLKTIATVAACLILGLFILVDVLTGTGNALANTYLYAAIGGFLLGLAAPKNSIIPILLLSVNVDLLKRFMVVYGYTAEQDLYWIMGLAPLMLFGIVLNLVLSHLTGKARLPQEHQILFIVATILCSALTISQIVSQGFGGRALGNAINGGLYWYLIFAIPVLYSSVEERAKLLKVIFVIFVPVALYMFWHYFVGLNDFELDYLASGLSIEGRVLFQNTGALNGIDGGLRGFSTMSGASVVSTMLSTLVLLVMTPIDQLGARFKIRSWMLRLSVATLFIVAAYFTMTRKGWFCGLCAVAAYWALRNKVTIVLFYTTAIVTFVAVVLASSAIVKYRLLDEFQVKLHSIISPGDNVTQQKVLIMGTMYDRFKGWSNLTEPDIWTPFGFKIAGMEKELDKETATRMWGHDITVDLLIKLGYVPLFFIGVGAVFGAYWLHSNLLAIPNGTRERKIATLCLALAMGISFGAFANANQLKAFPQNLYAFLFLGITAATILENRAKQRVISLEPASEDDARENRAVRLEAIEV